MVKFVVASALAAAACGGGSRRDGVTCDWVTTASCWKDVAAAAAACTDPRAVGTFDAAQTTCAYADGTVVHVDPAALVSTRGAALDVTVVSSTAAPCAHFVSSGTTRSLTTRLGTFTADHGVSPPVYTCPDGTRFHIEDPACMSAPGFTPPLITNLSFQADGVVTFGFYGVTSGNVWRCQGAPLAASAP